MLVEISGQELNAEEMIKLGSALRQQGEGELAGYAARLHRAPRSTGGGAREYEADTGVYIRPICLVQVERTAAIRGGPG